MQRMTFGREYNILVRAIPGEIDRRLLAYLASKASISPALADKGCDPDPSRSVITCTIVGSFPPLPEQRAIAHVLGTLDDKIELNRRMNETLEEMARALFKSWFVDFEPVRAKMDGRWRRGESCPACPPSTTTCSRTGWCRPSSARYRRGGR